MANDRHNMILLVQPDRDDRDMYVEFLRHVGLRPVPVSTATDALPLAVRAAVVITGILLPGQLDGIAFLDRLRGDERTKQTPVIVLTASAWQTERERALRAGCDMFLSKPCLPDVLAREICHLLPHNIPKPSTTPHAA